MFKRKTWTCSSSLCSTDYLLISFFFSFPAHKILFTHFSLRFWLFSIYHLMATKCLNFCGHACSCLFWTLQIAEVGSALRLYIQWRARHLKAHGSAVLLLMQVKVGWYNFKPLDSLLKCLSLCISSILLLITSLLPYILFIYIFFNLVHIIFRLVARLAGYQFGVFSQMSASLIWTVMLLFRIYCLTRIKWVSIYIISKLASNKHI